MSQQFSWEISNIDTDVRFMDVIFTSSSTRIPMRMPLPIDGGRVLEGDELNRFVLTRAPFDRLKATSDHVTLVRERLSSLIGHPREFTEPEYAACMANWVRGGSPEAPRVLGTTLPSRRAKTDNLLTPVLKVD